LTALGITLSADVFTCLEFNNLGDYLAAGDKSGRIYVFNNSNQAGSAKSGTYSIYCAFTSHEPEFDYLKSLEIEEKINAICWLPSINNSLHLLSTNDKVIKLWRMSVQHPKAYNFNFRGDETNEDPDSDPGCSSDTTNKVNDSLRVPPLRLVTSAANLRVPRYRKSDKLTIEVRPRRVFANAHTYHINAISVNSDQETFLSADDLRINLWHLDITNQSFTIIDLKPANMEELSEVITCSRFHPEHCHLLAYSTSRGVVRLCDMRQSALCDNHLLVLDDPALSQQRGFFADIIASLSDFRFDHSGNYILARDYLNLKVWDVRNGSQPCEVYSVHEPLRSQLCMLYESDGIFDKFLCSWSEDDRYVATGSYGNVLRIFDRSNGSDWMYDLGESNLLPAYPGTGPTSLRPRRTRLRPKQFIAPDSQLGSDMGLTSVFLAHANSIESSVFGDRSPPEGGKHSSSHHRRKPLERHSRSITVPRTLPAGSKRRKQALPSRSKVVVDLAAGSSVAAGKSFNKDGDKEDDEVEEAEEEEDDEESTQEVDDEVSPGEGEAGEGSNVDSDHLNGGSSPFLEEEEGETTDESQDKHYSGGSNCSTSSPTGLRQLDFQRKFMQITWHPQRRLIVSACGNQLFLCCGKQIFPPPPSPERCSPPPSTDRVNNEDAVGVSSPLDVKAAKRRRRRKGTAETVVCHLSPPPLTTPHETPSEPPEDTIDGGGHVTVVSKFSTFCKNVTSKSVHEDHPDLLTATAAPDTDPTFLANLRAAGLNQTDAISGSPVQEIGGDIEME
uniref:Serine/threonine-protein phosphatase 2A 55 kDa regulatory subunit B n=1 Tax=Schistocephalus solidus TaxID=70667 RepID=A0A183TF39_SCHSO